jgi:hypothetical protein
MAITLSKNGSYYISNANKSNGKGKMKQVGDHLPNPFNNDTKEIFPGE